MTHPQELRMQRLMTKRFVATRPLPIVVTPHVDTRTASGATSLVALAPLPQQIARLVEVDPTGAPVATVDGVSRTIEWMLLAEHDATLPVHGTFVANGSRWSIEHVYPFNDYEVRVGVIEHGPDLG